MKMKYTMKLKEEKQIKNRFKVLNGKFLPVKYSTPRFKDKY